MAVEADRSATAATVSDTLLASVRKATDGMTAAVAEEDVTGTTAEVLNATNATGLVILLASVVKRRTVVTSATEQDTLPGIAAKKRIPATTVTWWGI